MQKYARIFFTLWFFVIFGCASTMPKPPPDADYGDPPQNYKTAIADYFETILFDAGSARYRYGKPYKAYSNKGLVYGGGLAWFGYAMPIHINAKNKFGGYVGYKPYVVLFQNDKAVGYFKGHQHILLHRVK